MRNTQETFSKDNALSKHTEQILVLLPKEITQKLDNISERISRRSELKGFAILVNKTNHTVVESFILVYYLLTIIPIFHFMDSLTIKIVIPTDSFFQFLGYGYQFPQSITKKHFY